MKKITKILLSISLILTSIYTTAQVTVGSQYEPEKGALLDIKGNNNTGANSTKGLGIPRVMLSNLSELYPMYGTAGYEDTEYTQYKDLLKQKHAGLTVYNLTENEMLVPGFYLWDGSKWLINELIATPFPDVEELVCYSVNMYPPNYQENTYFRCIFTLPYIGGNGGSYTQFDDGEYVNAVQTIGGVPTVTDFKVKVAEGTLAVGNGQLILIGEGTLPSTTDPFSVDVNIFGKNCSFTINRDESESAVLTYRSGTFLNVEKSSTTEAVTLGNIAIRYNNGYYEYMLLGPYNASDAKTDVSWLYRKAGSGGHGLGVYGRYYPERNTWNSIGYRYRKNIVSSWEGVQSVGTGSVGNDLASNANINLENRDIAVAHFFIQTDKSHDVYRVTFNANTEIPAGTNAPAAKSAISIILERLEDHGDGGPDL